MNSVKFLSCSSFGTANFLINGIRHSYAGIDGGYKEPIERAGKNYRDKTALNIAKRNCTEWKKEGGDWQKK
jgi:hypothetical protein